jgi:phosphatidylglycerol:prolipoprotein diacylglycerol transferase
MFPVLHLGFITLPMYGICIFSGLIAASLLGLFMTKLKQYNKWDFVIIATLTVAFGFIGAKVLYLVISIPPHLYFATLISAFSKDTSGVFSGGFVFYGGYFGGVLGYYLGTKIAKTRFTDFVDVFCILVPLVHGFGRIGCFCAGCCYGINYSGLLSVRFAHPFSSAPINTPLFPVQLLEAFLLLFLSLCLFFYDKKNILNRKRNIRVSLLYFASYSVIRFFLEFLRFDKERGFVFGLSTSQIISLFVFVLSLILYFYSNTKKEVA